MFRLKRRLTEQQEFEILKLVLDKFLWLGFIIMGWGLYAILKTTSMTPGLWYILSGAAVLVLFVVLMVKEYDVVR